MDSVRFDQLTRAFSLGVSRRGVASALGLATIALPSVAEAKKRKRKKKKKVRFNEFGCVNVGNFCKNGGQCCSGICQGKKGKKKCKGHDSGTGCEAGVQEEACGGTNVFCMTAAGIEGVCDTTTGNDGYCLFGFACFPCSKDADCQQFCGPAAVCVRCAPGCPDTGGTACGNPTTGNCPE